MVWIGETGLNNIILTGTGLLPITTTHKKIDEIVNKHWWEPWQNNLDSKDIKDKRRFFNRVTMDIFRPMSHKRWYLNFEKSPLKQLKLINEDGQQLAQIIGLELLKIGDTLVLYYTVKTSSLSESQAYDTHRKLFSFFPKTSSAQLPIWSFGETSQSLLSWLENFLDMKLEHGEDYVEDWMGHELPYCLHVESSGNNSEKLLINFAAGANPSRTNYEISQQEYFQLQQQIFSVWSDWNCLQNNHRLIFCSTADANALRANLFTHKYYIDLYVLALFQRIQYAYFQEQFSGADKRTFQLLFREIKQFRKQYQLAHVSTYPLAQRLYDYFSHRLFLRKLDEQVFREIDFHNSEEQREQTDKYNTMLFSISVIAAVVLPLNSLSALFAIAPEQRDWAFWLTSALSGIGILLVMLTPVWWRKRKLAK